MIANLPPIKEKSKSKMTKMQTISRVTPNSGQRGHSEGGVFRELQQHYRWHEMERNAKRFAAAILMPGNLVARKARSTYQQLVHKAGFDNVNAVKKYLVSLLAKDFVVSVQSMDFRLREWPMQVFTRVEQAMQDGLDYWD